MSTHTPADAEDAVVYHARCQAVAVECGYPVEAVMLVLCVLGEMHGDADGRVPTTAKDLCEGVIAMASKSYADRAYEALRSWRITTSEDVGRIAASLAKAGLVALAPGESAASFRDLFMAEDLMHKLMQDSPEGDVVSPDTSASRQGSTLIPRLIEAHFQPHPVQSLTITQRTWPFRVRVDLQRAIDQILATMRVAHFSSARKEYSPEGFHLHDLMLYSRHDNAVAVPCLYEEIDIGDSATVRCLKNAMWLLTPANGSDIPMAVLMAPSTTYGRINGISFEIAVPPVDGAIRAVDEFFQSLDTAVQESKSYRGKVLSLEQLDDYHGRAAGIVVHHLHTVEREQVILPAKTLELLERNVIQFVDQRQRLRALSMQTKKGLLFYGPPGTGKTHTIHFLAGALPGHTALLMTAEQVGLLAEFITLARLLQPSILVIEDADLIARNREKMHGPCEEVALNRLLNEMDGLREDADILFILTTNRPEMLEPALSARPGRIDQAIEFPLPDAAGREKLIRLYARGATLDDHTIRSIVGKTEGVSAAFIKELMRRAVQFSFERADETIVALADVDNALEEMLFTGGSLNRTLLGAGGTESNSSSG